jgi:hypothetical protein
VINEITKLFIYIDINLKIDNDDRLRTKPYDKLDDYNFLIVNRPFICSNIPAAPVCEVKISQLIRYLRAAGSDQDVRDREAQWDRCDQRNRQT